MKFTDGYWRMRKGVVPFFPHTVWEVIRSEREVKAHVLCTRVRHRGDTLNVPLLTVRIWSPREDVLGVEVVHHLGGVPKAPDLLLLERRSPLPLRVEEGEEALLVSSGRLAARISTSRWGLEFLGDGRLLTDSKEKNLGYVRTAEGEAFLHEQLRLGVEELIYGLGERFTPFVKNGQVVEIWNGDGGTSSELAYKNVPFYLSSRGYGVFVNDAGPVSFEVGSEKVSRVQFSVPGERLEYFIIYGPHPMEVLEKYTDLTGKPALPPAWSFGLWLTTSFITDYDETTVRSFVTEMKERGIPLSVFHFDCFWMKGLHWTNFLWDRERFPDPEGLLAWLKEQGVRSCVWINPYIAQQSEIFMEGMERGFFLRRPDGTVWQTDDWQAGMAIVDFTNPEARRWFASKLERLLEMGVDSFKTDFGERIPVDVIYYDGSDPMRMHNYYSFLYNRTVFEVLERKRGRGEAVCFARAATAGGQQFPVHWGGDCVSTYESMAESLRGGLSLMLSGFGFWSHDIGGFEKTATPDLYKRWVAFGLLSSHSRLHGNESYRVPWLFDEEAVEVLRFFTALKHRLMPYLYTVAVEAHRRGVPVMRPLILEFPEDPGCRYVDREYLLGPALLVAPVFGEEGEVAFYLPPGLWRHLLDGEVLEGPGWFARRYDYFSLPLFQREGSVLVLGKEDAAVYDYTRGVVCEAFLPREGRILWSQVDARGEPAASLSLERRGDRVIFACEGFSESRLVVHGGEGEGRMECGLSEEGEVRMG
ncbi:alpha-xylosidase [Spirochaeta thermophila]|uniref:alpha-D-xyloside xylohydrolase n=1 Tax=Winmispira thermophila (strain ATCC 49972 / DSM 6192 / RI 19.B1) TaxID=665571 RepID=E0RPQ7_WINT6|nr:alpha-xylosidase [Spirochaeta thermophila]ADN01371.1 glycoside hydrolase, family 31 [Spirochaeta thermophila DSM 6192]